MKTNFENIGGSYSQQGDYLLPNLTLLDENQRQISVWAVRHRRYLKSSHRVLYYNLLTSSELYNYLADVERQAENLFEQTIKSLAEQEQVTEKLKAENMMLWVQKMNNIRNRARHNGITVTVTAKSTTVNLWILFKVKTVHPRFNLA